MWELAEALICTRRPADFNQGMMELGATVCVPREPKCLMCPVIEFCATRGGQAKPKQKEVRRLRPIVYSLAQKNGAVWLVQRPRDAALMPGMWELPEATSVGGGPPVARFRHSILDTDFDVAVYKSKTEGENGQWVSEGKLPRLALTGLARKILRHFKLL